MFGNSGRRYFAVLLDPAGFENISIDPDPTAWATVRCS
jgi:hypothetical protein